MAINQTKLQPSHYEVFGYESMYCDKARFIQCCKTKKEVVGIVKIMIDEMNLECINIFKVRGALDEGKISDGSINR